MSKYGYKSTSFHVSQYAALIRTLFEILVYERGLTIFKKLSYSPMNSFANWKNRFFQIIKINDVKKKQVKPRSPEADKKARSGLVMFLIPISLTEKNAYNLRAFSFNKIGIKI